MKYSDDASFDLFDFMRTGIAVSMAITCLKYFTKMLEKYKEASNLSKLAPSEFKIVQQGRDQEVGRIKTESVVSGAIGMFNLFSAARTAGALYSGTGMGAFEAVTSAVHLKAKYF